MLDAAEAVGVATGTALDGTEIDLAGEWATVTVHGAVSAVVG